MLLPVLSWPRFFFCAFPFAQHIIGLGLIELSRCCENKMSGHRSFYEYIMSRGELVGSQFGAREASDHGGQR